MSANHAKQRRGEYGHAVIEVSFLAPWIFFLFVGALDFGFYAYGVICTENAARVAAMQTAQDSNSQANSALACQYALPSLKSLPNTRSLATCAALPVIVSATAVVDADGDQASQVAVTYQSLAMIPIPGLTGTLTLTRTAQMKLRQQP